MRLSQTATRLSLFALASITVALPISANAQFVSSRVTALSSANCPAGTSLQNNGTCLVASRTGIIHRASHRQPIVSGITATRMTAACPAGTSSQADGTCRVNGVLRHSSHVAMPTRSSPYNSQSFIQGQNRHVTYAPCPAGTLQQGDNSCLRQGHIVNHGRNFYPTPLQYPNRQPTVEIYPSYYDQSHYGQSQPVSAQTWDQAFYNRIPSINLIQSRKYTIEEFTFGIDTD